MNLKLKQNNTGRERRGIYLLFGCMIVGAFALYIALVRANMAIGSDVAYAGTMLFEASELAYLSVELLAFLLTYAFVLFAQFQYGTSVTLVLCGVYAVATLARRLFLALIDRSVYATLAQDFWESVGFMLADAALEFLQLGIVVLICVLSIRAFRRIYAVIQNASMRLGRESPKQQEMVYPIKKNTIFSDAIKRAALGSAATVSIVRVIGRLIYDFMLGAPTDATDALWMVLYYSVDILIGAGGYFLILHIVSLLMKRFEQWEK